jgi:hypothetical protein
MENREKWWKTMENILKNMLNIILRKIYMWEPKNPIFKKYLK